MHEHDEALAAPLCRHKRRAIFKRRPGLACKTGVRLGEHLPGHSHLGRNGQTGERRILIERRKFARLLP